jgi:hypothetical protein
MSITLSGSLVITGSIIASAGITGSFSGSATTSSYALSASSVLSLSQSVLVTGSLQVTGSIATTGTITAQTLVVQTVTSSIVYSSGSNIFGNSLTDTQKFTGSVLITGSQTVTGASTTTGTANIGNDSSNARIILKTGGSTSYSGNITTNSNTDFLNINGGSDNAYDSGSSIGLTGADRYGTKTAGMLTLSAGNASNNTSYGYISMNTANTERMKITYGGNVLVGTTSVINPAAKLEVKGDIFITPTGSVASKLHLYNNDSTNETYIYDSGSSSTSILAFAPGGATKMVVNSSGNVGIGTSSPESLGSDYTTLDIKGKSGLYGGAIQLTSANGTNKGRIYTSNDTFWVGTQNSLPLGLLTADTERMRINSGGGVNIGGSTWTNGLTTANLDMASVGLFSYSGQLYFFNNCYHDGSTGFYYKYTGSGVGGMVVENSGNITFPTAPSGTAGNLVTLTTRMTITQGGSVGAGGSTTNIYNASDLRLKQNVTTITNGLDKILGLNPVKFNWVDGFEPSEDGKDMLGFIAQEVQNVIPEAVENFSSGSITLGETIIDNPLRVNEKFIIPILVKAIQELKAEIEELKKK